MKTYDDGCNPTDWLASEKHDGVCAVWDGANLRSRDGNRFDAPDWFTAGLPRCELRGELWCGRGRFEDTLSICRTQESGPRWRSIIYMVFDGPAGLDLGPHAERVRRWRVESRNHLAVEFDRIVAAGGEGLVLRDQAGTDHKLKPLTDDDAVVIGHAGGTGRNAGRCGALVVRDRDGREFRLGTGLDDETRDNPPPIGSVVVFAYEGRTRTGMPRFARYLGTRAERTLDFAA